MKCLCKMGFVFFQYANFLRIIKKNELLLQYFILLQNITLIIFIQAKKYLSIIKDLWQFL